MPARTRLTLLAEADIRDTLRATRRLFGPRQVRMYANLIEIALEMLADDPRHPASMARPDIAEGVRSLHLDRAAGRRGGGAHQIFYSDALGPPVVILRLLHEAMEPGGRIADALRGDLTQS